MADFQKVYTIKFNTKQALSGLRRLNHSLRNIDKRMTKSFGAGGQALFNQFANVTKRTNDEFRDLDKNVRRTGKGIRRSIKAQAIPAIDELGKAAKRAKKSFKEIGQTVSRIGSKLTRTVTLPIVGAGVASLKLGMDLNKSMANVSTLLSGGSKQINGLKRDVQDLSTETGKSTEDMADGLYEVVSALGENEKNIGQLRIATRASVAGVSTVKESVKLLSAVTKGYGDTSEAALKRVSDLAFETVRLGQTTYPELAASMGRVIPLAAAMDTTQEELFATMATLTGVTGDTAEVSTQLASVYSSFLKPAGAMDDAVEAINKKHKEYNFESGAAMLKALGFRKALMLLNGAVDGNEGKLAKILKRKEALVGALALLGGQSDTYTDKLKEMSDVVGATDEAYRRQTEGINKQGHEWDKTKRRMIVFAQRVGDKLLPIMERLFKRIEPWLKKLEDMDDATLSWGLKMAGLAAAIGPVLKLLGPGIGLMSRFGGSLQTVSTSLDGITPAKVSTFGRLMKLAQAGAAATGALALGYGVGSVASATIFQPHSQMRADKQSAAEEARFQASQARKRGGTQEKLDRLKELNKRAGAMGEDSYSMEDIVSGVTSVFTGKQSSSERREKESAAIRKEQTALESSIRSDLKSNNSAASVTNYSPTINNTTNVNGGNINEKKLAREQSRMQSRQLKNAASQLPAGER